MEIVNDNHINISNDKEYLNLLYFTATWCGPCQKIKPMIQKIAEGMENKIKVFMIDIDENEELAEKFKIRSVPTFILLRENKKLGECSGANIINVHKLLKENLIQK